MSTGYMASRRILREFGTSWLITVIVWLDAHVITRGVAYKTSGMSTYIREMTPKVDNSKVNFQQVMRNGVTDRFI
jgi:hypothetical protein